MFIASICKEGMAMTITLELSPEAQSELRTHIAHLDAKSLRQLLAEIFAPAVEGLLRQKSDQIKDKADGAVASKLAEERADYRGDTSA